MKIKFNQYNVNNGTHKVRVTYSLDNRYDKKKCITIYAKDYLHELEDIFPDEYINNSDPRTDYFVEGKVNLFEDHPLYKEAREKIEFYLAKKHKKIWGNK